MDKSEFSNMTLPDLLLMNAESCSKRQRHFKTHCTLIPKFDFDWSNIRFILTTVFH